MSLGLSFQIALRALAANKLRAALTMLGMIIGVGAVIALMSVGRGAQASVLSQIQSMGTNVIFIRPGAPSAAGVRGEAGSANTLTLEDATAIAQEVPGVALVAPESGGFAQLQAGGQNYRSRVVGTTPDYQTVRNFQVAGGEFITQQQVDGRSSVVVLGPTVAQALFAGQDPVGQTVRANNGTRSVNLRVIGVLAPKGGSGFGNQDDQIVVPLTTLQTKMSNARARGGQLTVRTINVQVAEEKETRATVQAIGDLLRRRHRVVEDDFSIQTQEDILATAGQVTGVMTILLGSIAGISLVVGGIGIMNIMLVSVTERTREIGIRKAIGAKRRDILVQFLVEAVTVSVAGGLIGVIVGWGASRAAMLVPVNGQALQTLVTPDAIVLAFGVSALIGIFFGIYPASRASRLNPIEALRYE